MDFKIERLYVQGVNFFVQHPQVLVPLNGKKLSIFMIFCILPKNPNTRHGLGRIGQHVAVTDNF